MQNPTEVLIDFFNNYLPLNQEEITLILEKITHRNIKRRQMVLQEGFVCKHYFFVVKGCFKMYGIDNKGNEHNIQFAAEGDWIMDIGSFHTQKPSQLFIEAIEPAEVFQIEQQDLYFLYLNIPKLDRIFKVIVENKFVELQNRVLQTFSSTAEERYLDFLERYSDLASRLPNTQIASYLGITPEFLSKIRRDLSKNKPSK
ncbi:Crp/Fnr family transcriptional regulator [Arcicella lustrica]|uniref:Crp/Fnr family transcriptional regulator n=1 Tax=Arcicella lustrica TaxID=2984196 RepID=A0ABU5SKG5_9BACT|nr:Crp/Fnr family transcriptional regulator [Arcicella sp. DC25W]MEA5427748.1 Crp/Fnr family transcriptional regulator [Arcicella sp. DC25W]